MGKPRENLEENLDMSEHTCAQKCAKSLAGDFMRVINQKFRGGKRSAFITLGRAHRETKQEGPAKCILLCFSKMRLGRGECMRPAALW